MSGINTVFHAYINFSIESKDVSGDDDPDPIWKDYRAVTLDGRFTLEEIEEIAKKMKREDTWK